MKVKAPTAKPTTVKPKIKKRYKKATKTKKLFKSMGGTSQLERDFEEILKDMGVSYIPHYRFSRREFDFCLDGHNLLIELHGCHWHCCPIHNAEQKYPYQRRSVKNDIHKEKLVAASNDYHLLVIWEHEMKSSKAAVVKRLLDAMVG